jgi:hypothetical protein
LSQVFVQHTLRGPGQADDRALVGGRHDQLGNRCRIESQPWPGETGQLGEAGIGLGRA